MNEEPRLLRRQFLAMLLWVGPLGAAWRAPSASTSDRSRYPEAMGKRLIGAFASSPGAKEVGAEYLQAVPDEASVVLLISLITATNHNINDHFSAMSHRGMEEFLYGRIGDDFVTHDVIVLRGWLLSRTEARLCALAHLIR
jgi:hypothetical protein